LIAFLFGYTSYAQVPVAAFTANKTSGCAPLVVTFTDQSANKPTSWNWDLGNGTLSQAQNPTVVFALPGIYSVQLVVQNADGTHGITKTNYITVFPSPQAGFNANLRLGCLPTTIQFTDLSTPAGTISSWQWDFGDGTTSTAQNPQKAYTSTGFYTVSLKVTSNTGCTNTVAFGNYIRIVQGVTPEFDNSAPITCRPPFNINFSNLSSAPGNVTYQWNFGNSTTSTQPNPTAVYAAAGTYNVSLTINSQYGCSGSITKPVTVTGPAVGFTAPASVCLNETVSFQNSTSPAPLSSIWYFGNGAQSTNISDTTSYSAPGVYNVKVINTYETCIDSANKPITVLAKPVVDFTAPSVTSCKAPATVNFQDLSPDAVSWQWDFGDGGTSNQKNPVYTYLTEGQFQVSLTVTDSKGCTNTVTKPTFVKIIKPFLQFTNIPAGGCIPYSFTPKDTISAIDGVTSWFWDFGDGFTSTQQNPGPHVYIDSGTYTLKLRITTTGGCTDSVVVPGAIRTGPPPVANFSFNGTDTCAGTGLQFTDHSAPADKWTWNFGDGGSSNDQNPFHEFVDTGYFNISLTAYNNGCARTFIHPQKVHIKPPVASFEYLVDCNQQLDVTFVNKSIVDPIYGPVTYTWSFGDPANSTSNQQNPVFVYPALGRYTVTLIVSNGTCSASFTSDVELVGELADFSMAKPNACKDEKVLAKTINVNPANIATYEWSVNGSSFFVGGSQLNVSNPNPAVIGVALRITDLNGCKSTKTIPAALTITGPAANFTAEKGNCSNTPITFTDHSTPAATIRKWTFDFGDGKTETFTNVPFTHSYTDTGVFVPRLVVEDNIGCTNSYFHDTVIITRPTSGFEANLTTICPLTDIQFSDTSKGKGLIWSWDFGDGTTSTLQNPVHNYPRRDSMYTVKLTITDSVGCKDIANKINYITVKGPKPAFDVRDSTTICPPIETGFTFRGQDYESFYWDFGDGSSSTLLNPTHFYNTFGSYKAKLYLVGYGGCLDSTGTTINLYNPQQTTSIVYAPLTACNELMVDFTITTPPSTKFTFNFGDGRIDTSQQKTLQHFYGFPSFNRPSLILTDKQECQVGIVGVQDIKVIGAVPLFGVNQKKFCDSGTVLFTNYTVGNDPVVSRIWDFKDPPGSTDLNPAHRFTQPGTYVVSQSIVTQTGCPKTITDTIRVYGTPHPRITGDSIACINDLIPLQGNLTVPDTSITWAWNLGKGITSANQNVTVTYPVQGDYSVSLVTTNLLGCKDSTRKNLFVPPAPFVTFTNNPVIPIGAGATLPASYSPNIATYIWTPPNNLSCTDCPNPFANPKLTTKYKVQVEDIYGCTTSNEVTVTVVCNGQNYFMPNTFSPNGDGVNDVFAPRGSGLARISSLKIFNRWGELVFERRNFMANDRSPSGGWDGTYKGKPASADVYVYMVEFICENAMIIPVKGNVTLIR
jgi:gliding motility-associated-like protein